MIDVDSIRRWINQRIPPSMIRLLRSIYWRLLSQPKVEVLGLEDAYGKVTRHNPVQAQFVPVPEALSIPMAPFAPQLRNGRYKVPEDYVTVLNNLLYCPINEVVMTEPGKIIAECLCTNVNVKPFPRGEKALTGYYTPWRTPKNNHYHTLIDNLPRLISLADYLGGNGKTLHLLYSGELSAAESFVLSEFCPPNVEIERVDANTLYRVERMVLTPFKTRRYAGFLPERYVTRIRKRLLPNRPPKREHRLLISRVNTTRRHILNLDKLSPALAIRGFQLVELENLDLETQIELFYDAEMVVAAHGAGLANILFANDLQLLELFPCAHVVPHYFYLSKSLGHKYAYWCGREASHHSNFSVNVGEVTAILDSTERTWNRKTALPLYSNPLQNHQSGS